MVEGSTVVYAGMRFRLTSGRSIFRGLLLALVGSLPASGGCRRSPPPPAAQEAPLEAAFAGCVAVVARGDGVACELNDARLLRVVVPKAVGKVTITAAHGPGENVDPVASRAEDVGTGTSHSLEVPAGAERIVVRTADRERPANFTLRVGSTRKLAWVDDAKALRGKGDLAGARALAEARVAAADEAERSAAQDLLARIALAEGHAEQAFPHLRTAIASHRAAGRISDAVDDSFALAFALHQRSHRYDEARAALDAVASELTGYPEGRAREPYYRGILASETGDRRAALTLLREAETRAHHLGMSRLERNTRAALALEMQVLGRSNESLAVLKALERDPEVTGCERVEIANDLGWGLLLASEGSGDDLDGARPPLERAVRDASCSDAYLRSFALGNLARLELQHGDSAAAKSHLESARDAVKDPRGTERLAWLDLEARILLAQHEPEKALARFDEERGFARAGLLLEAEWNALVGRAEAFEALDRRRDAVAATVAAEEVLDRAMLLVPLGEGRGAWVADRSRSARAGVDLLVALGRHEEAARLARRSRTRLLASVERALRIELLGKDDRRRWEAAVRSYRSAREAIDAEAAGDWKLPADALARTTDARKERERALRVALEAAMAVLTGTPRSGATEEPIGVGDLEIVIHPGRKEWVAFASDASGTTSHRVTSPDSAREALAASLLAPIAPRIVAARRVRVRAYGGWRAVDVHALPFAGAPLFERVAVDYPLGLRGPPNDASFERRALIVGDPSGNLAAARAEAGLVAKALEPRMAARLLLGPAATSRAVTAELSSSGLFHYAGHGLYAGEGGWSSSLPLADGGQLTVGDLLALAPAPRKAVLLGCDAARADGESEGVGLAQALVTAGTEEVFAPVRMISDALAAKVAEALYAGPAGDAACDLRTNGTLATAARAALASVRAREPDADWSAFRVLAR
jgi:tetratricopeptide (TPR) repeat protein